MKKPRKTAFCMADGAQVLETLCGDADLVVFTFAHVGRVRPHTELKIGKSIDGKYRVWGSFVEPGMKESFERVVELHPQMMVGWSRAAIKKELCARIDRIFDDAKALRDEQQNGKRVRGAS